MKIEKYAAIDIGSNAIRILISNVFIHDQKPPLFLKSSIVRIPVRLGEDSFTSGEISNKSIKLDIKILIATFIKQYRSEIRSEFSNSIKILKDANNV